MTRLSPHASSYIDVFHGTSAHNIRRPGDDISLHCWSLPITGSCLQRTVSRCSSTVPNAVTACKHCRSRWHRCIWLRNGEGRRSTGRGWQNSQKLWLMASHHGFGHRVSQSQWWDLHRGISWFFYNERASAGISCANLKVQYIVAINICDIPVQA